MVRSRKLFVSIQGLALAAALLMPGPVVRAQPADESEKAIDQRQMRQIYEALQTYRERHGTLPNWLSDLVPEFLADPELLISPVEKRTGRSQLWGYADPKLKTSYVYEFSGNPAGGDVNVGRATPITMREWKTLQMAEFGPATPLLRCHLHEPILNLSFSGEIYETSLFWESDPNTLSLMQRLGPGPGVEGQSTVELTVLDAETGQPLSGARVTALNRRSELGPLPPRTAVTDAEGKCHVPLGGTKPQSATLSFDVSDYAGPPVQWEGGSFPERFVVRLGRAVSVGGVVRDRAGAPVEKARVGVSGLTRDVVGQVLLVEYATVETDAEGRWNSRHVPRDFEGLHLRIDHPDYFPAEFDEVASDPAGPEEMLRADLLAGKALSTLATAPAIHGTVRNSEGTPVPDALALLRDTSDSPTRQTARTDSEGKFRFVIREPNTFQLVVSAGDLSPAFIGVNVDGPDLDPLDVTLGAGKSIAGRVVDHEDKPLPGASVFVQLWNDTDLLNWRAVTDAEGRFTWDNAPEGSIVLAAQKEGFTVAHQPVVAGAGDPLVIRLAKSFLLTGTVIDAETSEPVPQFKIIRAMVWDMGIDDAEHVNWEFHDEQVGSNGKLSLGLDEQRGFGSKVKFMIRAEGYLPVSTPTFESTGWHVFDASMKQGTGPAGVVRNPNGQPIEGASVAIVGAGYLSIGKATIANTQNREQLAVTDAEGRFQLPALIPSPTVLAIHELGFATVTSDELTAKGTIQLESWGRITGMARAGTRPWANIDLILADPGFSSRLNYDWSAFRTTTDAEGRFEFSIVPPGQRQIAQLVPMTENSWAHGRPLPIVVPPGQTVDVVYGGSGRPVKGRLKLSDPNRTVDFNVGHRNFATRMPRFPGGFTSVAEAREWQNSPEVREARRNHRYYAFRFDEDGSFRIENVAPGDYSLSVQIAEPGAREWEPGAPIGSITRDVTVPEIPEGVSDEPLDLGELVIEVSASGAGPRADR